MKTKLDEALFISNPRIISAVYFAVLAIVANIIIDALLYAIGIEQLLPVSKAIILAAVVAACFGALFGERIVHSDNPYKKHAFYWAFLMVILALPIYNLGLLYLLREKHMELFAHASFWHLIYLYLFVLVYSFILAGVWLAVIAGLAAIYLRGHVVYYILQSHYKKPERPTEVLIDSDKKSISVDDTH